MRSAIIISIIGIILCSCKGGGMIESGPSFNIGFDQKLFKELKVEISNLVQNSTTKTQSITIGLHQRMDVQYSMKAV